MKTFRIVLLLPFWSIFYFTFFFFLYCKRVSILAMLLILGESIQALPLSKSMVLAVDFLIDYLNFYKIKKISFYLAEYFYDDLVCFFLSKNFLHILKWYFSLFYVNVMFYIGFQKLNLFFEDKLWCMVYSI